MELARRSQDADWNMGCGKAGREQLEDVNPGADSGVQP